jgi:uncharacterized membrane protein YkoI
MKERRRKQMLKKVLTGTGIAAVLTIGVILGSLTLGPVFAHTQATTTPTQAVAQSSNDGSATVDEAQYGEDDVKSIAVALQNNAITTSAQVDEQQPQYAGSTQIDDNQYQGMSEADEAAALQSKATISAASAEQAALVANPGITVVKTELDNENGVLVYSVELSNGMDVKVDAGTGTVLHTEPAGNDAGEAAGSENTSAQEAVED